MGQRSNDAAAKDVQIMSKKGGVCIRHGAKKQEIKRCSYDGCTNQVQRRGVCKRHGAYRSPDDESTAFALSCCTSAYDDTTATLPNQRTAAAAASQDQRRDPPGVIVCTEADYIEV
mmetsp:Transcript_23857/g.47330  ORF Transcript_23857/g.47330 Transcript_23857/m.47330 type:complete len:116 (-) Transcript_23857:63-410(-)